MGTKFTGDADELLRAYDKVCAENFRLQIVVSAVERWYERINEQLDLALALAAQLGQTGTDCQARDAAAHRVATIQDKLLRELSNPN